MFDWAFGSDERPPIFLKWRSSKIFILLTVASSVFTDLFAYSVVVPVFPFALTSRAGVDANDVQQWTSVLLAVYGAALLVTSPLCGWLSDRMGGRQGPFLFGLLLLAGSTVMLCVGESLTLFAIGRALQGASATVVWVVGLALIVDTVGPDQAGAAMGTVSLAMSAAIVLGPLLGGIVFASAGYYAVYAIVFALIGMDLLMRVVMIEKSKAARWLPAEDTLATTLATEEKADDTKQALTRRPSNAAEALPPSAPTVLKKILAKMPPVVLLLGSRRVLASLWGTVIVSTLFTAFDTILPLFVKNLFNWNSTGAGLIFLPICIATLPGPIIGKLSDRYGPRWFAAAGFIIACPSVILLRLVNHNSLGQKVLLAALLFIVGIGLEFALTPIMAEVGYAVEAKTKRKEPGFYGKNGAYAQGYGLFNMAWAAGSMIGPLLAGFVNESEGWATTMLILGCVSIFSAVPTVIWTGGSIFKKIKKDKSEREGSTTEEV